MSEAQSSLTPRLSGRAAELRREFDRAFAEPVRADTTAAEDLLGIEIGGQRFAIRLSEIAGLFAGKKVTRIPGGTAALLGIAGFRGALLPVYDLQALLGHPSTQAPRWLVIAAAAPVAFAFEAFVGQLRVARGDIAPRSAGSQAQSYAREYVRSQTFMGPILHLPSVLEAIKAPGTRGARKEE